MKRTIGIISVLFFTGSVLLFLVPRIALAQFSLFDSTGGIDIGIQTIPQNPKPNSTTTLRLESFNVDLDRLFITWTVDGIETAAGVGIKEIEITSGPVGSTTDVSATVLLTTGESTVKRVLISPGTVDLLWEVVDSYTPHFYKGKALPSRQSTLKVTALPQVASGEALIPPSNFKYIWEHDYSVVGSRSGFGSQSFSIVNGMSSLRETIGVQASNQDGTRTASSQISIPIREPEIVVYEKDPELGKLPVAATDISVFEGRDITLLAEPFFFSTPDKHLGNLEYEWRSPQGILRGPNNGILKTELPIENPGQTGELSLGLSIEHPDLLFQTASENITINFRN